MVFDSVLSTLKKIAVLLMPSIKKYCNFEDILVKCKPSFIYKNFMAVWMHYNMDLALKKLIIKKYLYLYGG